MSKTKQMKPWQVLLVTLQPIVFLFLTVFVTRSDIKLFFAFAAIMLIVLALTLSGRERDSYKKLAYTLVALSSIGLAAASVLTIEKIELLKNPEFVASCSFSPIVACSPVIASEQASALDSVPNPIIGIFGFAAVLTAGMTMLAGANKLNRMWWLALLAGVSFNVAFCIWLLHAGLYEIGALCLYCLSVWLVTFSMFWFVLAEVLQKKMIKINKTVDKFIIANRDNLIAASVATVILLIYFRWSDYWNGLL